jgi:hypothetical protein
MKMDLDAKEIVKVSIKGEEVIKLLNPGTAIHCVGRRAVREEPRTLVEAPTAFFWYSRQSYPGVACGASISALIACGLSD